MAFNQRKLDKVYNQSRGIFDRWVYRSDEDTIAEITSPGYFAASRFADDPDWKDNPVFIDVLAADGTYEVQLVGGVASVVGGEFVAPESFGLVGDYDPVTGEGTDNSAAFARMISSGRRVGFFGGKKYKVTQSIEIKSNTFWIGDFSCEIYPDFASSGSILIKNEERIENVSLSGVTVVRVGNNAEHGVILDDFDNLHINLNVIGDGSALGGAIGASPFYPRNKPGTNLTVNSDVDYGGNFGIQVGNVKNATLTGRITNTQRECIGLEPYALGRTLITSITSNTINYPSHEMSTGDPVLYSAQGNTVIAGLSNGGFYFAIVVDDDNIKLAANETDAYDDTEISLTYTSGTHAFYRAGVCDNVTVLDGTVIETKDLASAGSLTGSIIVTATSGGYHRNCTIGQVSSTLQNPTSGTQNISVVGGSVNLVNPIVNGANTDGISFRNGTINAISDETGSITPSPAITIKPRACSVVNPRISNFRGVGLNVEDGEVSVYGGEAKSAYSGAVGLQFSASAESLGTVATNFKSICANGTDYSATRLIDCRSSNQQINSRFIDRAGNGFCRYAVNLTTTSGAVCELTDKNGDSNNFSGLLHITAKNTDAGNTETTSYVLNVVKRANGLSGTLDTVSSVGLTTGGGASHPSFTWTIDASNNLIATVVGSTNANKTWYFYISSIGDVSMV